VKEEDVWAKERHRRLVEDRSSSSLLGCEGTGCDDVLSSGQAGISIPAVSKSVSRGEQLAGARGYSLLVS